MEIKQKAVKGVAWTTLQRAGTQFVSFIVFTVLSRFLEPEAFGLVAIATVFISFIQIFLDQGLGSAIIQRDAIEDIHLSTAFWSSLFLGLILTVGGYFAAIPIANLYNEPDLKLVLQFLSLSLLFHSLRSTQQAIIKRDLSFKILTIRTLLAEIAGGSVGILMAIQGYGVWSLVGRNLVRDFTGIVVLWTASAWRPSLAFSSREFKDLFQFGINVIVDRFFLFIIRNLDQLLIGYFLGSTILGYYVVAFRLVQLFMKMFLETIAAVAFPVFSRLQTQPERIRNAFFQTVKLSATLAIPSFIGIGLIAPEFVVVFFGEKWLPSIPVMRILSLLGVIQSFYYLIPPLLFAVDKPNLRLTVRIINTIGTVVAILVGVRWGIEGVALAFVFKDLFMIPIMLYVLQKAMDYGVSSYLSQFSIPLITSVVMAGIVMITNASFQGIVDKRLMLFIMVSLGALIFGILVHLLDNTFWRSISSMIRIVFPRSQSQMDMDA